MNEDELHPDVERHLRLLDDEMEVELALAGRERKPCPFPGLVVNPATLAVVVENCYLGPDCRCRPGAKIAAERAALGEPDVTVPTDLGQHVDAWLERTYGPPARRHHRSRWLGFWVGLGLYAAARSAGWL